MLRRIRVPYALPDRANLERALLAIAPVYGVGPQVAPEVIRNTVETATEPFRRADGSYRFENRFRYLIAGVVAFASHALRTLHAPVR